MDGLTIKIGWEYFLGIMAALILVAYYSNGRFTALETSMKWVQDILRELKLLTDNSAKPAFATHSPVNLNETGKQWLVESGLGKYVEDSKEYFLKMCQEKKDTNPYEVQKHIFRLLDEHTFDAAFEDKLKKFAFEKGTTMAVVKRIAAIHVRNLCLDTFGMNKEDIDKHKPENEQNP